MAYGINVIPSIITSVDANAVDLNFVNAFTGSQRQLVAFIKIVSGTWKFGVGAAPTAESPSYTSADVVPPITFNPSGKLYVQADAAARVCNITI